MQKAHPKSKTFDEHLTNPDKLGDATRKQIVKLLKNGIDVYASDLWCGWTPSRKKVVKYFRRQIPKLRIMWLYYENSLSLANNNCKKRRNKGDAKGHIKINRQWSKHLTPPKNAVIMKIHKL